MKNGNEIVILGGGIEGLAVADYLHRANFYYEVLLIDEGRPTEPSLYEEYICMNIGFIEGQATLYKDWLEIKTKEKKWILNPNAIVIVNEEYLEKLASHYSPNQLKLNHLLQAYLIDRKIFISPLLLLRGNWEKLRKKTGTLVGQGVSKYLSGEYTVEDIELKVRDKRLEILPHKVSKAGRFFLWYFSEKPLSYLDINDVVFSGIHPTNGLLLIEEPNEIIGDKKEIIINPCYEE